MKVDVVPENVVERIALRAGLAPRPLLQTLVAIGVGRTIIVATKLGVFEVLAGGPRTAADVASELETDARATEKLLNALVGMEYVRFDAGAYSLAPTARKWLLKDSPSSLHDWILELDALEWNWLGKSEEFVRTGRPLEIHSTLSPEEWGIYQRGMRAVSNMSAGEIARRVPVPRDARDMLDIGGSHGYISVAVCRRHPSLRSVVLDLPEAVEQAAPILAKEEMGERVVHRAGDALTDDLGVEAFDVVFAGNVVHHFDDAANRDLARRVARALRRGGVYAIHDVIRPRTPTEGGQTGTMGDLFFALTSEAGTWSFEEMAAWQRAVGLEPQKPVRLRMAPGFGLQIARKP